MKVGLTELRATLSDKMGSVLTPELVAEIVFRTAQAALSPPKPAIHEPEESH